MGEVRRLHCRSCSARRSHEPSGRIGKCAVLWFAPAAFLFALPACFETYCQAGQKGTQCVTGAELEAEKRAQGREEPPSESTRLTRRPWSGPSPAPVPSTTQAAGNDAGLTWRSGLPPRTLDGGAD
jgi:hypothetical protein